MTDRHNRLGTRRLAYLDGVTIDGADVRELQTRLSELGYPIQVDGRFGPLTDDCVRQFQTHRGLCTDGVFGPETFQELHRVIRIRDRPATAHYLRDSE